MTVEQIELRKILTQMLADNGINRETIKGFVEEIVSEKVDRAIDRIIHISIHALREEGDSKSGEKIRHVCSIIHTCAQFEKELYEGSGEMQNKSC